MAARATIAELQTRLSPSVCRRIYDDNNDGAVDTDPIQACLDDAGADVDGILSAIGLTPLTRAQCTRAVITLELDFAQARAAQRHPEVLQIDGFALFRQAKAQGKELRMGDVMLGATPPDPAANHGGEVYPRTGSAETDATARPGFFESMGDF